MRIIVCGGRDFVDVPRLWRFLDKLDAEHRISTVIDGESDDLTGEYVGADYWGHQWALARGKTTIRQRADWKQHGRAAGPIRNGVMLKHKPDMIVAASGGRGTENMITQAQAADIPVQRC